MAALSATLTEFSTSGDSRTWTTTGHTVGKPKIVIQKRRVPAGAASVAETQYTVVYGTDDSNGDILPSKVSMAAVIRFPVSTGDSSVADALTLFRDMVQSTEFGNSVTSQNFLK